MITDNVANVVQGYIDGVMSGEIVVSRLVRGAVERHIRDLSRQSSGEFPYYFDAKSASKAVRFYPMFLRHSIGRHAGMPFELEPWQAFGEWCLYGWKRDADQTRRFRRSYESVARKNGKTTRGAGRSLLMAMADQNPVSRSAEQVAQVILCATKKEQAEKVAFEEILRMRLASTAIRQRSDFTRNVLRFPGNSGSIACVGSDKPFDGLNPHYVLMDELHAWREYHREFYDTMVTGSGARSQPLIAMTTTAGDDKSHLWREIYEYAKGICIGTIIDESFFAFACEIDDEDDPLDEACWIKANPNLGVSVSMEYLRQQATEARSSAAARNRFLRYHCNRLVSSSETAFDMAQWDGCSFPLSDWSQADAIAAAVDLGSRDDLAAYALCARFRIPGETEVYRYEIKAKAYIATDTKRELTQQPFAQWIYDERIKKSRYPIAELHDDLLRDCQEYNIRTVAYDPYNGQQLGEELEKEGMVSARMAQNHTNFNEPIQEFTKAIQDGRIYHGGNPLLRWCATNAVINRDRNDRWMFDKKSSAEKIDPLVASVMAFRVAMLEKSRPVGPLFVF